jgi:hypothetical protein
MYTSKESNIENNVYNNALPYMPTIVTEEIIVVFNNMDELEHSSNVLLDELTHCVRITSVKHLHKETI